jgi:phospholipase/carboxylesterase
MGAVMSYALGLAGERPVPGGIMAFSGFVPTVDGWTPDLDSRARLPVFIAHGRGDPVIGVEFGRRASGWLEGAGLVVTFLESDVAHQIDPAHIPSAVAWLDGATAPQRLPNIRS